MTSKMTFSELMDNILTGNQQRVLAICIRNNIRVHLYGTGMGKTITTELFKIFGFKNISAPEDCTYTEAGALSVPDQAGTVALCVKKTPWELDFSAVRSYTERDIQEWLNKI